MTDSRALQSLKELLVLQHEKLEVLRKAGMIASMQVMERRIKETKAAIKKHDKQQPTR